MRGPTGKVLGLLFRVVAITALTFFLALPETVRAHSDVDAVGEAAHDLSQQNAHITGIDGISGHCHPGLDCFVTAVLSFPPNIKVSGAEANLPFSFLRHSHESWTALFDPPPPRIRS